MTRLARSAILYRSRGRRVIVACLGCAQAMAPDWPVLILWPLLKLSLASSIELLSGRKPGRPGMRSAGQSRTILRVPRFRKAQV
jgi:hypothetical protein